MPGQHPARLAGELVTAFKSFTDGWGDRLAYLLRQAFYALQHRPNSTLLDVALLLREKSPSSERLRGELARLVKSPLAKLFWQEDFAKYRRDATGPPQHKLGKLLLSETEAMLSQPESAIDMHRIMNDGQILVADLSRLETDAGDLIGCFLLSLFYVQVLARSGQPPTERKPFMLYCDEAHRCVPETLESLLCQLRKFKVGATLAHQYLRQFAERPAAALESVGATLMFNVGAKDAGHLVDGLRGKVDVDTLTNLPHFTAVLQADGQIVRITTPKWATNWSQATYDRVVAESHHKYYKHVSATAKPAAAPATDVELTYDVFD